MGASCVQCANIWKCTRSTYVTRSSRCRICADDMPPECMYYRRGYSHGGYSMFPGMLLLLGLCAIAACIFWGRNSEPEVVVMQGQPGIGPNGQQVVYVNQGGYGGGYYGMFCTLLAPNPCPHPGATQPHTRQPSRRAPPTPRLPSIHRMFDARSRFALPRSAGLPLTATRAWRSLQTAVPEWRPGRPQASWVA